MQEVLTAVLPEVKLRLYGSSCTKFGFKDSDVNIDIQFPPHMHQPDVLLQVQKSLSVSLLYCDLEADFHARVPVVICKDKNSGLVCKVSAGNDNACLTTSFLFELSNQEPLLLPLVLGFRHWARICHVDRAEEGGLPSYVLALMVIYFLQQRKRPVLPSYLGHEIKEFSISRLHDFSLTMEDGCVHWGYYPVSKDSPPETIYREGKAPLVFQNSVPPPAVGLLWVELLRFYSLEFNMAECVISVRTSIVLLRDAKDWPRNAIAVEDPFAVKRNVARTLNSQQMYEYILHCLKSTYKYFALPLSLPSANHKMAGPRGANYKQGPSQKALSVQSGLSSVKLESQAANGQKGEAGLKQDSDCMVEDEEESPTDSDNEGEKEDEDLGKNSLSEEEDEELDEEVYPRHHLDSVNTEDEELFPLDEVSEELLSDEEGPDLDTPSSLDEEEVASPKQEVLDNKTEGASGLCYGFTRQAFTRGKSHTVVCSVCKRDGHLKKDCPEDFQRVQLAPLPPMTPAFLTTLNTVCQQCYRDFAPDEVELGVREHILLDLESFVKRQFTGARLRLFGSSKNGFGFKQSDLDICMVLDGQETAEVIDLYLLSLSASPLCLSLSSLPLFLSSLTKEKTEEHTCVYLYYRRGKTQRNTPVIPVLQEIYDEEEKPEVLVDGWNVYFYHDLEKLPERWQQRNVECVGALWLGLLQFYTETFDFREHVISIRQSAALTTFNKQWTSKYIVIEDPFDLNHNLGAGLSRRMTNFIMKAFINGRSVFGTAVNAYPPELH
nr:LOW QUALITY PROTEIN: terminal uridylyltransferase 7-like [Salvelinus alpinus]